MNNKKFNIDPYQALKSLLEVTSTHLGESFLKIICHELKKLFEADLVLITKSLNSNPTTNVKILYTTDSSLESSFELEGTPCELVYKNKIIQITKDVNLKFEKEKNTNYKSFYGIPLHNKHKNCTGHIAIMSTKERTIPSYIEDIAFIFARRIEVEYERNLLEKENKKVHKALKGLVNTDSLTKLYNRRYFNKIARKTLSKVKKDKFIATLCYLDIDNFKKINDTYGHDKGDETLIYLSKLLEKNIRKNIDFLFRVGGEEFAIISIDSSINDSYEHVSRIQKQLKKDKLNKLKITLSIGLESFQKTDTSFDDVYKKADKKMYNAKKSGKNCIIK
jgi:diguanylate cyclase (GGDEF)-like protein